MGKRPASESGQSHGDLSSEPGGDHPLVVTFNSIRDELTSTLVYMLGHREDALDAVQDCFLKCWRAREVAETVVNLRAWIFRVGLNTAKDMQRSAWNRRVKPLLMEDEMISAHEPASRTSQEQLEDRETMQKLREAIQLLRHDEKEVFLLRQNGDFTYEQIAELRDTPVGTVKTQMRAALIKLRKILNPTETIFTES